MVIFQSVLYPDTLGGSSHLGSRLFHPSEIVDSPFKNPTEITRDITELLSGMIHQAEPLRLHLHQQLQGMLPLPRAGASAHGRAAENGVGTQSGLLRGLPEPGTGCKNREIKKLVISQCLSEISEISIEISEISIEISEILIEISEISMAIISMDQQITQHT